MDYLRHRARMYERTPFQDYQRRKAQERWAARIVIVVAGVFLIGLATGMIQP